MPLTISKRHFVSAILLFGVFVHAWCLHATPIDFMESKHRTSPFALTDGEETMLPFIFLVAPPRNEVFGTYIIRWGFGKTKTMNAHTYTPKT